MENAICFFMKTEAQKSKRNYIVCIGVSEL